MQATPAAPAPAPLFGAGDSLIVIARKLLGGILGGFGRQTASSGMAFISSYAIGEAARRYYAGGRKLEAVQLREIYQSMLSEARSAAGRAQDEIQRRAGALRTGSLADALRSA